MDATQKTTFEETAENLAAEEEAFLQSFGGDTDSEPEPEPEPEPAAEPEPEPTPEPAPAAAAEPAAPAEPKYLTMEDFNAVLAQQLAAQQAEQQKKFDKVFGLTGNLQQRMEKFETAKKQAAGLSPKARERVTAQFPELAELLFEGTEEPEPEPAPVAAPVVPAAIQEPTPTGYTPEQVIELRLLKRDHKDWETVVASEEFNTWRQSNLTPEDNATLDEAWDADFVSSKLTDFKTWKAAQQKQAEINAAKAAEEKLKKDRLAAALTPQGIPRAGGGSGEDDEESGLEMGYKPWNGRSK